MRKLSQCRAWPAVLVALSVTAGRAAVASDPCASAAALASPAWRIDRAAFAQSGGLAPHCVVTGVVASDTASGIGFGLRLPLSRNRRLLFQGGGGLDGAVKPALGAIPLAGARARPGALARGYAVVSMDGGHEGFACLAAPRVTRAAKEMATRFYGAAPRHSYFMGCSNGGREAMMAAERDPEAFDGIVAGDPGFNLAGSALEEAWETALLASAAPRELNMTGDRG